MPDIESRPATSAADLVVAGRLAAATDEARRLRE
jgi:hypothetical protein